MYTTPLDPVNGLSRINNQYTRLYNNPHFDYLSEMLPKNIKELFKWCEIVFQNLPVVANGIRKLINYPVSDFTCTSQSEELRDKTKDLLNKIHLKSALLEFGTDYYVYGNVFRTVYLPFLRMMQCKVCNTEVAIDSAEFRVRNRKIEFRCPKCQTYRESEFHDIPTHNTSQIRIVRWDPKQIELNHNPVTGSANYYYEFPKNFVNAVMRGDLSVFRDTPKIFIDAVLAGKNIQMGGNFYHARTSSLAGYNSGWGISPLLPALKIYMYIAVLRKSAEAIGMEQITPQRILFPQSSGTSDPAVMSSMDKWQKEIVKALQRWRIDPNYVMTAPYPTGIVNIGSQGRQLIPTEEIKDARMEVALALDIPPGIIMGDTNIQNSAVSLKMLENQLLPYTDQLKDFANWVIQSVNTHMKVVYSPIELVSFKLANDLMTRQMLMQAAGTLVSRSSALELLGIDPDGERKKMVDDQVADQQMQMKVEKKLKEEQENAAAMAQQQAEEQQSGMPSQYNQQKMIAMAQQQAMQLLSVPYEQRRSMLAQLQNEDYVMWALVSKQLEALRDQQQGGLQG